MNLTFEQKLENFAEVSLRVGVGLQAGQRLLVVSSPENTPLVHKIVKRAYELGARLVEVLWDDEVINLIRLQHAPLDSLDEPARVLSMALNDLAEKGDAILWFRSKDPALFKDIEAAKVGAHQTAFMKSRTPYFKKVTTNGINWCLMGPPIASWAKRILPHLSEKDALETMWDAVFKVIRADVEDPVGAWTRHNEVLRKTREYLNAKQYAALKLRGGGTDLTIGLPKRHIWGGGAHRVTQGEQEGLVFTANLPTEEVWTLPHREQVNGVAKASKPLSYAGVLITDIEVEFKEGRIVSAKASQGEETLKKLIATDNGSHHLGEIALVPHSSPVSQTQLLFCDTLYDENAASHIAIGSSYRNNLEEGIAMTDEAFRAAGGNISLVHVDWMIGHDKMDVWGIKEEGTEEPIMVQGEWAFSVDTFGSQSPVTTSSH